MNAALHDALATRLLPKLREMGFEARPPENDRREADSARNYPFGTYERMAGDTLQLVEIQVDRDGLPRFVMNFGTAPKQGITYRWAHFRQGECEVFGTRDGWRLHDKRGRWFEPGLFSLREGPALDKLMAAAALGLDEIAAWFDHGVVGPNMVEFRIQPDLIV